jgi:phosphocarrier protein HPr
VKARLRLARPVALFMVHAFMRREVEIVNELGLHARPAAEFVRCVQSLKSEVTIRKGDEHYSGASILEVLSANLDFGSQIVLEAIGPDASQALDQLEELLLEFRRQEERGMA